MKKYARFQDLFVNLSGAHMSTDDTDFEEDGAKKHPATFTITRAAWMSAAFRRLCRQLDTENIQNREPVIGDQGSGGNGPRARSDATPPREADTRAPTGLWRDCYYSVWLKCLKEDQLRRLDVINDDFGLSLPSGDAEMEVEEAEENA